VAGPTPGMPIREAQPDPRRAWGATSIMPLTTTRAEHSRDPPQHARGRTLPRRAVSAQPGRGEAASHRRCAVQPEVATNNSRADAGREACTSVDVAKRALRPSRGLTIIVEEVQRKVEIFFMVFA